jgi:RNA polymerase sigma factor (sigma-70 family)
LEGSDSNPLVTAYLERRADIVRYFRARLRSDAAAEDLVQDIYLKVCGLPPAEIGNPGAYLFRIGANLMFDRIKVERRGQRREAEWRQVNTEGPGEGVAEAAPADMALDARQRLQAVIEVVDELPPQVREAFRLHKLEGLTHAETAKAMKVSRSSVEKYLMTCLSRLNARIGR